MSNIAQGDLAATRLRRMFRSIACWFDTGAGAVPVSDNERMKIDYLRAIPFAALHLACLAVFWVGWSWTAVGTAIVLYYLRMFAMTGFYHRYFSHRTFKTSRFGQFLFALWGATAVQKGALWWAAHHRHHHRHSDLEGDLHSARRQGFFWSHIGWITARGNFQTNLDQVPDLAKFPELRFLNRFDVLVPALLAAGLFLTGMYLETAAPGLGTDRWQMLVWGFFVSTVTLMHCTFSINSLTHMFGRRRYQTTDDSRNNWLLALVTMGEGWHNNHHYYPGAVRQGFYWWEIDLTYYGLKLMSWLGIIWDLNPVPKDVRDRRE